MPAEKPASQNSPCAVKVQVVSPMQAGTDSPAPPSLLHILVLVPPCPSTNIDLAT